MPTRSRPAYHTQASMLRPAHLDAQRFVDGNNLEEEGEVSLVGYVSQSVGFGSKVILQQKQRQRTSEAEEHQKLKAVPMFCTLEQG